MNQATKKLFAVLVFTLGTMSVGAQAKHVRIRLFAAMDPIGQLTGMGMGPSSGDLRASSGYGFAPGVEAFWLFGQMVEAGVGFQWQIPRQVYRSDGGSGEFFNFVPLYGVVRIKLDTLKSFKLFLTAKVGYTFFIDSPGFQNILSIDSGGPLVSSGGGLYAAGALGVTYILKDRQKWGLDLSVSAGYGFFGASAKSSEKSYPINFQAMTVDLAVELRL